MVQVLAPYLASPVAPAEAAEVEAEAEAEVAPVAWKTEADVSRRELA